MPSNKKYSIAEAAQKLGMTRQAVHTAIQEKRLKAKHGTFEVQRTFKVKGWIIEESMSLWPKTISDCCVVGNYTGGLHPSLGITGLR